MAAPKFTVTYSSGRTETVGVGPKAQVAFERHFKTGMPQFTENPHAEHVYFLAWVALHYSGREANDFDTFLGEIEDVQPEESDKPNPTELAQESGTSSN